ncbi:MAG: ergothioneine biosynthesis protein EgtB [Pseudomonadales bacterium]|nr:ergothioneine biosynthesis protein EgtB [Pseudomonadales bacterium]
MEKQTLSLAEQFLQTRQRSFQLCEPLERDDYCLQAAAFASPPKWHLAHTTWFFETFILKPFCANYQPIDPIYEVLFNSYYNGIGEQFPRPQRGLLSRPSLEDVTQYRETIDSAMCELLQHTEHAHIDEIKRRCVLGIEHEKQHQELLLTDIKYSLSKNPICPTYIPIDTNSAGSKEAFQDVCQTEWVAFEGGVVSMGVEGSEALDDFSFDNESPKHDHLLQPFKLASRLVTNAEFQAFIDDGGYQRPEFWLADGWTEVQAQQWERPLYWRDKDGQALEFTLHGLQSRNPQSPVCHVSAYEADAFANWDGARLPTEFEWEYAASQQRFSRDSSLRFHPDSNHNADPLTQLYDQCWQWTASAYRPYPGFSASKDAIGEYNGKFMCNQWVLRGGSCVSPPDHVRATYRNFFYPADRWQFFGIRLAK